MSIGDLTSFGMCSSTGGFRVQLHRRERNVRTRKPDPERSLGPTIGALPAAFTLCIGRSMLQILFGEPSFDAHAWPDSLLSVP
jgi:hypothetical protein